MCNSCEFNFRVWVCPKDGDPSNIETWFQGLESTDKNTRTIADWTKESLANYDLYDLFHLDQNKYWQVVGKAVIEGWTDCFGEYDESIEIIEFEKTEVPKSFFDDLNNNRIDI